MFDISSSYLRVRYLHQPLRSISCPRYEHQRFLMSSTATMSFSSISSRSSRGMHGTTSSFMMLRPLLTSGSSPLSNMAAACSFSFCGNHTCTCTHYIQSSWGLCASLSKVFLIWNIFLIIRFFFFARYWRKRLMTCLPMCSREPCGTGNPVDLAGLCESTAELANRRVSH